MTRRRRATGILAKPLGLVALGLVALGLVMGSGSLAARPALTGTGGGPETTITAPHTAPSGQTMPPGLAGAPGIDPEARTARQRDLDRVLDGICVGCR